MYTSCIRVFVFLVLAAAIVNGQRRKIKAQSVRTTPKPLRDRRGRCIEKKLNCDPQCTIRYKEGCPYNCNCGEPPRCPRVHCPLPEPQCLVLTQRNGCQTCGCKNPVVVMENDEGKKVNVFVTVKFLSWSNGHKLLAKKRAEARTARRKNQQNAVILETFATRITKIPLDGDVDPSIFEKALIDAYRNNGSVIQRHNHFLLLETIEIEPRVEPDPYNPGPVVQLTRNANFVPPPPRFRGQRFTTPPPPVTEPPLTAENCTDEFKDYIDAKMKPMYWELNRRRDPVKDAAFPYPLVFKYSRAEVLTACSNYWSVRRVSNKDILDTCRGFFGRYDEVLRNYEYPCGFETQRTFFRDYSCLHKVRLDSKQIQDCEDRARYFLEDPFTNRCDVYTILADCVYDQVVDECGKTAFENQYKFMSHVAKYYDPHCLVLRPYRTDKPFNLS